MTPWLRTSIAVLVGLSPWPAPCADTLRVYRCTDAAGQVSLQDVRCAAGEREQPRDLPRPRDGVVAPAPVPAQASATTPASSPPPPPVAPVARPSPAPLYDCVQHDGSRYESDSGVPQRRWVPLWVLGLDPRAQPDLRDIGRSPPPRTEFRPDVTHAVADPALAYAAGTWVEDRCVPLPAEAICARRQERLQGLRRQQYGAQQGERDRLREQAKQLQRQLVRECGAG